jgi:long-chain acyl-CoA synthetase
LSFSTIAEIIRAHAAERGDRIAMRCGDQSWSYAELRDEAARVAQALLAEGVAPGERVAVLDKNAPEYFSFLFGAAMVNAVTLAVNWRLAPPEMEYILNHSETRVLLVGEEFLGHLAGMELDAVKRVVVLGEGGGAARYGDWIAGHDPVDPEIPADNRDTCYQLYTSGTTGLPKGVELTNRNILECMKVGEKEWAFDANSVNLVAMPLFHISGSGWGLAAFFTGGQNVLMREVDPVAILRTIEKRRITNALFVPAVLQLLLATPGVGGTDFSSLRRIVYGASPITEDVLVRSLETMRCGFVQVYGLTETTGAVVSLPPEDHEPGESRAELLRSAGKPWGDTRVRIVDPESGRDQPEGAVGEIWIHSVQTMRGYWRNPEATAESFPEGRDAEGRGWFKSGDAGFLKNGYLYIHDRVKDMIVSGGENIYPAEVENVLASHPGVADVAVIGVPSEQWGESVKAVIVPVDDGEVGDEALIEYCRERLAHYKCPSSVDRVAALPRNPSGKILKTELREPYWKGHTRRVH